MEGNLERELDPGFVSGEELRELLREDTDGPREAASGAASASRRVLAVLRRGPDGDLLSGRLKAGGMDVTVLRNPFGALDQMRRDAYDAVVSDLELWANRGALLLDRLAVLGRKVPVLLLASATGEPRDEVEAFALKRGAWRVLFKPLGAADVEKAVLDLREECIQCAAGPAAAEAPRGAVVSFGPAEAELAWLRFFFDSFLASREEGGLALRAGRLLAAAMEHLRPRAAGVFFTLDGRPHALLSRSSAEPEEVLHHLLAAAGGERVPRALRLPPDRDAGGSRRQLVLFSPPPAVEAVAARFLDAASALLDR